MTEDEKEEMVYRLWDEFRTVLGKEFSDQEKYAFIAGARAALYQVGAKTKARSR